MLILAMDSSTGRASVSICKDDKMIAEMTLDNGNKHSETLLPMTAALLEQLKLTVCDIDLFASTVGPGSFTGVRIGVCLLKGLAFGKNKPCVGLSSLEMLAYNMLGFEKTLVCSLISAGHGNFYTALFEVDGQNVTRACDDGILDTKSIADRLSLQKEEITLVGDGARSFYETAGVGNVHLAPTKLLQQCGQSVALAALSHFGRGDYTSDLNLAPVYLRASQAEREREMHLAEQNKNK